MPISYEPAPAKHPAKIFFDAQMPKGIAKCRCNCRISGTCELKAKPQCF